MDVTEIILISFGLAMDAFTVSLSAGTSGLVRDIRGIFRLSFHFGLFQFLMPIIGWFLGMKVEAISSSLQSFSKPQFQRFYLFQRNIHIFALKK